MKEASVEKDLPDSGHKEVSTQFVLLARFDIDIIQLLDFRFALLQRSLDADIFAVSLLHCICIL